MANYQIPPEPIYYELVDGNWYYLDEAGERHGPFSCRADARAAWVFYCETELGYGRTLPY